MQEITTVTINENSYAVSDLTDEAMLAIGEIQELDALIRAAEGLIDTKTKEIRRLTTLRALTFEDLVDAVEDIPVVVLPEPEV
jgi:hypothetical protein